jgi:hypothetical protein
VGEVKKEGEARVKREKGRRRERPVVEFWPNQFLVWVPSLHVSLPYSTYSVEAHLSL